MGRHNQRETVYLVRFRSHGEVKTASVVAASQKRAESLAGSFPRVVSVAKAQEVYTKIENKAMRVINSRIMSENIVPRLSPIAMDEFLWIRRTKRIENKDKDKLDISTNL